MPGKGMAAMTTWIARTHLEPPWWVIEVDGVGATQARSLALVESVATDMIATVLDIVEASKSVSHEEIIRDLAQEINSESARMYYDQIATGDDDPDESSSTLALGGLVGGRLDPARDVAREFARERERRRTRSSSSRSRISCSLISASVIG